MFLAQALNGRHVDAVHGNKIDLLSTRGSFITKLLVHVLGHAANVTAFPVSIFVFVRPRRNWDLVNAFQRFLPNHGCETSFQVNVRRPRFLSVEAHLTTNKFTKLTRNSFSFFLVELCFLSSLKVSLALNGFQTTQLGEIIVLVVQITATHVSQESVTPNSRTVIGLFNVPQSF